MSRAANVVVVLLALQLVALAALVVQAGTPGRAPAYEYEVDCTPDHLIEDELLVRGLEGWQIANARRATAASDLPCYEIIWTREA